jgi:Tfp pilus assembly protein FimT
MNLSQLAAQSQVRAHQYQETLRRLQREQFGNLQTAQQTYSNEVTSSANQLANLTNQARALAVSASEIGTQNRGLDVGGVNSQQLYNQRQANLINQANTIANQLQSNQVYLGQDVNQVEYARKLAEQLTTIANSEYSAASASEAQAFLQGISNLQQDYSSSYSGGGSSGGVSSGGSSSSGGGGLRVRTAYNPQFLGGGVQSIGGGYVQARGKGYSRKELFEMLQTATDPWERYQLETALANYDNDAQQVQQTNANQNAANQAFNSGKRAEQAALDAERQRVNAERASAVTSTNPFYNRQRSQAEANRQWNFTEGAPTSAEVLAGLQGGGGAAAAERDEAVRTLMGRPPKTATTQSQPTIRTSGAISRFISNRVQ